MSTGINHNALLSVGVIAAAIVAVICLRCCDNDYKDSWNPRSKERQYLADYNHGYNEGFESGRLDYIEDYYVEGDYEEDWW